MNEEFALHEDLGRNDERIKGTAPVVETAIVEEVVSNENNNSYNIGTDDKIAADAGAILQCLLVWFLVVASTAIFLTAIFATKYGVIVFAFVSILIFLVIGFIFLLDKVLHGWPIQRKARKYYKIVKKAVQQEMEDFNNDWNDYRENLLLTYNEDEDVSAQQDYYEKAQNDVDKEEVPVQQNKRRRLGRSKIFRMVKPLLSIAGLRRKKKNKKVANNDNKHAGTEQEKQNSVNKETTLDYDPPQVV